MQFLFTLVLSVVLSGTLPIKKESKQITATVINATTDEGKVMFALYTKDNFLRIPIQSATATIKEGKSTVVFNNIPKGEYAVVCYHDKNNNEKMDFSPRGMPIEDYGASNNIMTLGPPQFYNAKFLVADKDVSLEIKF